MMHLRYIALLVYSASMQDFRIGAGPTTAALLKVMCLIVMMMMMMHATATQIKFSAAARLGSASNATGEAKSRPS